MQLRYTVHNKFTFKSLDCSRNSLLRIYDKVRNARWILYMVSVRQKFTTRTTYKAHELQAKPKTRTAEPAQWSSNQPQLSRGDKTWRNSTNQWTIRDASHLHPSRSPTTGKMHECFKWSTNTDITCLTKWFQCKIIHTNKGSFDKTCYVNTLQKIIKWQTNMTHKLVGQ